MSWEQLKDMAADEEEGPRCRMRVYEQGDEVHIELYNGTRQGRLEVTEFLMQSLGQTIIPEPDPEE